MYYKFIISEVMKNRIMAILYIVILVLLDQISKYFFYDKWFLWWIFEPAFNTGISRSLPINMVVIIILTLIITAAIILLYKKNYIWKWAMIFLVWWTIWNLIDRIFLWWVRDFILVFKRFPVFNLADTFICTWAWLIIIKELFFNKEKK